MMAKLSQGMDGKG
jgi:hypothetical protein